MIRCESRTEAVSGTGGDIPTLSASASQRRRGKLIPFRAAIITIVVGLGFARSLLPSGRQLLTPVTVL